MKIEKGIPNPYFKSPTEYPWGEMGKGDSILIKKDIEAALESLEIHANCGGGVFSTKDTWRGVRVWKMV